MTGAAPLIFPLQPVLPKQLRGVQRADRPVAAGEILRWTIFLAAPADSLRMRRVKDYPSQPVTPLSRLMQPAAQ